jgi:hypothetical protein
VIAAPIASVEANLHARLRDPAMAAIARIPLLLALLCGLAAELPAGQGLPSTRGQLYERMLRWFLLRANRSPDDPAATVTPEDVDADLEILSPMAYTFASDPDGWVDLMPRERVMTAIRSAGAAFAERGRSAPEIVRDVSVGTGILVAEGNPADGNNSRYLFLHRTVAEYLVARHLATMPAADWLEIVSEHQWFDADWAEVIPMLGERLTPAGARRLIDHLTGAVADPFHHALLTALRVWGERGDADTVLEPNKAAELAVRVDAMLSQRHHSPKVERTLVSLTHLPVNILTRLLARLNAPDEQSRHLAIAVLAERREPGVVQGLLACLDDPHSGVRDAAVWVLAGRQEQEVAQGLVGRLDDPHRGVRRSAFQVLAMRQEPDMVQRLLARLDDPDTNVRQAAVQALAERDEQEVVQGLVGRLDDPDQYMRRSAIEALANRSDRHALIVVAEAVHTLNSRAALELIGAAERITIRHYVRCNADDRSVVLSAMAKLTARADALA